MTLLTENYKIVHTGDGAKTTFTYDFLVFNANEMTVYLDSILQTTGWSITGLDNPTGGTVVFDTAPADQVEVKLLRSVPYTQLVDYRPHDPFPAETHEAALDRIVMMIQQVLDETNSSVKIPVESPDGFELIFPLPGAGEFIKYTSDGTKLETADIYNLGENIVPSATDNEITEGTVTDERLVSPAQVKLGVETHETAPITSVFDVQWVQVVDVLPADLDPNTMYLVRE